MSDRPRREQLPDEKQPTSDISEEVAAPPAEEVRERKQRGVADPAEFDAESEQGRPGEPTSRQGQ